MKIQNDVYVRAEGQNSPLLFLCTADHGVSTPAHFLQASRVAQEQPSVLTNRKLCGAS
jgi:hypothetical protein